MARLEYERLTAMLLEEPKDETEMHWLASIGHAYVERHGVEDAQSMIKKANDAAVSP